MFPDRAALYVVAIEDRQYKDFKIHCKSPSDCFIEFPLHIRGGRHLRRPEVGSQGHDPVTIPMLEFVSDPFCILLCISL
jgi:hypothetical protein